MSRTAVIIGYYGAANAGDELLLAQVLTWLREMAWDAVVVSRNPDYTKSALSVDAVDFANLGSVALAMSEAQVVIFGGGGVFQDHYSFRREALFNPMQNDIAAYGRFIHLAQQYGLPVVLLGMGVGPLRSDDAREITKDLYERVDRFTLRDEASATLLRDLGLTREAIVAPDIGWAYVATRARQSPTVPAAKKRLAIIPRRWDGDAIWQERLVGALGSAVPLDWELKLIGFQQSAGPGDGTTDEPTLLRLADRLRQNFEVSVSLCPGGDEALQAVAQSEAVVSMRFHASLMALALRKPMVGLEYDLKMRALHDDIGVPAVLRLGLTDPASRYDVALAAVVGQGRTQDEVAAAHWALTNEDVDRLSREADRHRVELSHILYAAQVNPRATSSQPRLDWLALWAQSMANELKLEQAAAKRAHELMAYQQHLLDVRLSSIDETLQLLTKMQQNQKTQH